MSRWWRAYDEAVDDPKLILLSDAAHRAWFNINCLTSANNDVIPSRKILKIKLRMSDKKLDKVLTELRQAGLLDTTQEGDEVPHNWAQRQFRSDISTPRVKRFRQRHQTVSEAPPETETETETEKEVPAQSAAPSAREQFDFEIVDEDPKAKLFRIGKTILVSFGVAEKRCGALIGQWLKQRNDAAGLLAAIQFARDQNVAEPVAYISALVNGKGKNNGTAKGADLAFQLADEARRLEDSAGIGRPAHAE